MTNPDGLLPIELERAHVSRNLYRINHRRSHNAHEILFYNEHGEIIGTRAFSTEAKARHYIAFLRKKPQTVTPDLFPLN